MDDETLLDATVSTGYRPGGPNASVPTVTGPFTPAPFKSDTVKRYEVGFKTSALDERITINTAAFYLEWDDIQTSLIDPTGDFSFTGNGGKAHTAGLAIELSALVTERLTFAANLSVLEAEFDEDAPSIDVRSGDVLPNVPEFTAGASLACERPITSTLRVYSTADYGYIGESFDNPVRDAFGRVASSDRFGDYGQLGLALGVRTDAWSAGLFGRNLSDERGLIGRRRLGEDGVFSVQYVRPRVIGVEVKADF